MKILGLFATGLLATALLPPPALAGTESGFYLGAGVGQASVGNIDNSDISEGEINFDGNATGYKVFAGHNFGLIPLVDLAIEGGYVDFGQPDDTIDGTNVEIDATGWDIFGLVGVNLGPVGLFAKAGLLDWDADFTAGTASGSDSGTDPAYGVGLRMKFGSLEVRAEYEYFDVASANDVNMISASGAWTF